MESNTAPQDGPRTLLKGDYFIVDLPIRWGDCDALQHLNNVAFFRLMEEGRVQMLVGSGIPWPKDHGPIVVHVSCDFLQPFSYPGTVRVTHTVMKIGCSSIEMEVTLAPNDSPDSIHARGRTVAVWMDLAAKAAAPWPQNLLEGMGAYRSGGAKASALGVS
ncbi:MAG: acyl-CoA thioesterase [Burkholderiaceae bacterium]|nr:acyl-CoA thioesterase [Burkholderiaceae bacterium]